VGAYHDVAFYTFEIWDSNLIGQASQADLADAFSQSVTLRLAPQAFTAEQGFRADFGIDLAGNPVIVEAGFAPGRWTMRGVFGVGQQGLRDLASNYDQGLITFGLDNRLALRALFQNYADSNAALLAQQKPLLKMVFMAQSGGPSEWKNEVWWILPVGMPTDDRTASKPLDWSYSLTFWALQRVDQVVALSDQLNGMSITGLLAAIKAITAEIQSIQTLMNISQWPIVQTIQGIITAVQGAINAAQNLSATVSADTQGVADLLRTAAFAVSSLTQTVVNATTLPVQAKQDLICALTSMRIAIGGALLPITTNGALTIAPTPPSPVPVIPGRDLRQIAATVLGDESAWSTIAALNNLVYPFVSWPAQGGSPALSSGLVPGIVAAPGAILSVPSAAQAEILDPVGLDLDPDGGDFLVGSLQNLVNALNRRLNTPLGYLPQHPSYGSLLYAYLGKGLTVDNALAIRGAVAQTLLRDPRVTAVTQVTVACDSTTGIITPTATVQTILGPASFAVTGGS